MLLFGFLVATLIAFGEGISILEFFQDVPQAVYHYLVIDCDESILKEAAALFADLRAPFAGRKINLALVSLHHREIKPFIYTSSIDQVLESLDQYVCLSGSDQSPSYDTFDSLLSNLLPQMNHHDGIILFGTLNITSSPTSSTLQKLKPKMNQLHVLQRESTELSEQYENLIRLTWGQVITYNRVSALDNESRITSIYAQPHYKISVNKIPLEHNTRTEIVLPEGTFRLYINLHGNLRKAFLLSSSGIVINLLSTDDRHPGSNRSMNFDMAVLKSPSIWTLSCNGDRYNVTLMKLRNERNNVRLFADNSTNDSDGIPVAMKQRSIDTEHVLSKRLDVLRPQPYIDGQFDTNGLPNTNDFPTTIDVDLQSTFYVIPGEIARLLIHVRNNKPIQTIYHFDCIYPQQRCTTRPRSALLIPGQSVAVELIVKAEGIDDSSNIITFVCQDVDLVFRKIYLFIGRQRSDSARPDIGYEYNGNCDDANTGNTCHRKKWSVELYARDTGSGLLNFWSEPSGLFYTNEFIVGTRDPVTGRYTASCCETKVDILAMDLKGNVNKVTLDVEHQYLNWVEITAIVLGVILLCLIIALIIFLIVRWRRRREEMSFLNN